VHLTRLEKSFSERWPEIKYKPSLQKQFMINHHPESFQPIFNHELNYWYILQRL